ncbi:MAG: phospho-sugar mutase [Flavobacteriaceae bacterium]|nr:phospho-sugar mutase [Flavobacteriaceae bacterium]
MNPFEKSILWVEKPFDLKTRAQVLEIQKNPKLLHDSFCKDLEFGTGGMRGIMGIGSNRINKYTIGKNTQGLSKYLQKIFHKENIKVVIAYDSRNNSKKLSKVVANVLSANKINVYIFTTLRPTPELSFAIKKLKAHCGIVLTASHNPSEYNGYKIYWKDGGQIVPPQDQEIANEITSTDFNEILFNPIKKNITYIDEEIDDSFIKTSCKLADFSIANKKSFKIVFTPIHGTTFKLIPRIFKTAGFTNIHIVREQSTPDGDFPTVESPNPEDPESLKMAITLAESINADIVIGTDPDGDRLGIAIKNEDKKFILLNGNQIMIILTRFLLERKSEKIQLNNSYFIASTIVSSPMMLNLAKEFNINCRIGLTGFKWIAKMITDFPNEKFIAGGEESNGFLVGDLLRDKDALTSSLLACNLGIFLKNNKSSIHKYLIECYVKYGFFKEKLISINKNSEKGLIEISNIMRSYRESPPKYFSNIMVIKIEDYLTGESKNTLSNKIDYLTLPKTNLLRFILEDNSMVSIRPSGTEPKIKYYISVNKKMSSIKNYNKLNSELNLKIEDMKKGLIK